MLNTRIVQIVKSLNLPKGEYAIFGSALLEVYGLRDSGDIDFIVTKKLFDELKKTEDWEEFRYSNGDLALKYRGANKDIDVAFYDCQAMPGCDEKGIRAMIKRAENIGGAMFVSLDDILTWKKNFVREKDLVDVKLIEKFMKVQQQKTEILEKVEQKVKEMNDADAAHDHWHVVRVKNLAQKICVAENSDEFRVSMIALLHDVFDWKLNPVEDEEKALRELLDDLGVSKFIGEADLKSIAYDASHISFKGGANRGAKLSLEGQIAQDADRLDGIGAMGMARTFAYGGAKNREIYNPDDGVNPDISPEEYQNLDRKSHSIQHFYEKLLKLKDLMNTKTGREMAQHRHEFMEKFLDEFYAEWEGER
ncbi:HD domain-containing protein [Candidatus Saccharibacteria bacterium]|nr:HD domain-containing protein [Candidatus Saccharibacteria bacterium]MCL1963365.1 HD domain-containing protein [Candidatus Saccharibacteria bacterium]